jgi:hypothetical protein
VREGVKQALMDGARPEMEEGEEPKAVMLGQTFVSPLVYFLIGPLVFIFMARPRCVAATDRNVYVIEHGFWKQKEFKRILAKHPLGSVPVKLTGLSITIGDEEKVYALLGQFGPMEEIGDLAGGRGTTIPG